MKSIIIDELDINTENIVIKTNLVTDIHTIDFVLWDNEKNYLPASPQWQINGCIQIKPNIKENEYLISVDEFIKMGSSLINSDGLFQVYLNNGVECYSIKTRDKTDKKIEYEDFLLNKSLLGENLCFEIKRKKRKLNCTFDFFENENKIEFNFNGVVLTAAELQISLRADISSSLYMCKNSYPIMNCKTHISKNDFDVERIMYTADIGLVETNKKGYRIFYDIEIVNNILLETKNVKMKFYNNKKGCLSCYIEKKVIEEKIQLKFCNNGIIIPNADNVLLFEDNDSNLYRIMKGNTINWSSFSDDIKYIYYSQNKLIKKVFLTDEYVNLIRKNKNLENKAIPVAVWGSCYIRNAFNSNFNPNWRKLFNIVDEYFRMSVFSVTSMPIGLITVEEFGIDKRNKNYENVRRELEKNAFKRLQKANPEYLIVDFYQDAVNGVRKIADNMYVGGELAFSPDSKLDKVYRKIVQKKALLYDSNSDKYLENWKKHCDIFVKEIINEGLADKCILIQGYFSTSFWNEECNNIIDMSGKFINNREMNKYWLTGKLNLWKEMNNYFRSLLPETSVIDLSDYKYMGYLKGSSPGPQHFEPNYYRSLLGELSKIILYDKLL